MTSSSTPDTSPRRVYLHVREDSTSHPDTLTLCNERALTVAGGTITLEEWRDRYMTGPLAGTVHHMCRVLALGAPAPWDRILSGGAPECEACIERGGLCAIHLAEHDAIAEQEAEQGAYERAHGDAPALDRNSRRERCAEMRDGRHSFDPPCIDTSHGHELGARVCVCGVDACEGTLLTTDRCQRPAIGTLTYTVTDSPTGAYNGTRTYRLCGECADATHELVRTSRARGIGLAWALDSNAVRE